MEQSKSGKTRLEDDDGNTLLHDAIEQNNKALVEELLEPKWNMDINAENDAGATPLHLAAAKGYDDFIHLLLKKRAKTNVKDNDNRTFIDIIRNVAVLQDRQLNALKQSSCGVGSIESGKINIRIVCSTRKEPPIKMNPFAQQGRIN